jgi:hypothetical protein
MPVKDFPAGMQQIAALRLSSASRISPNLYWIAYPLWHEALTVGVQIRPVFPV